MRPTHLAGLLALLLAASACQNPDRPFPAPTQVMRWQQECGLLWIITLKEETGIRIQITGRKGETIDYGPGTVLEGKHLASSFCRADMPLVGTFHCLVTTPAGHPISGRVEAWCRGTFLEEWNMHQTCRFEVQVTPSAREAMREGPWRPRPSSDPATQ